MVYYMVREKCVCTTLIINRMAAGITKCVADRGSENRLRETSKTEL